MTRPGHGPDDSQPGSPGSAPSTVITTDLHLNVNPVLRYFIWLKGVGGCVVGQCNFGQTINQIPVNGSSAAPSWCRSG